VTWRHFNLSWIRSPCQINAEKLNNLQVIQSNSYHTTHQMKLYSLGNLTNQIQVKSCLRITQELI
jgi:hypothetical protein